MLADLSLVQLSPSLFSLFCSQIDGKIYVPVVQSFSINQQAMKGLCEWKQIMKINRREIICSKDYRITKMI